MPGYTGTPFFSQQAVFQDQPTIAAYVTTSTPQAFVAGVNARLAFAGLVSVFDPLGTQAYRTIWSATGGGVSSQMRPTVRGWYSMGVSFGWDAPIVGHVQTRVHLVEATTGRFHVIQDYAAAPAGGTQFYHANGVVPAVAGDQLEWQVTLFAGANGTTLVAVSPPSMWAVRVG